MEKSNPGGAPDSDSDSILLPSLKHDTSFAPRMLTPSEIDWLRRNKRASKAELEAIFNERERNNAHKDAA